MDVFIDLRFTDDECLAFYRALYPTDHSTCRADAVELGRSRLARLADAGWTAPDALCTRAAS